MGIYAGNNPVKNIYLGTTAVKAVYRGTQKIWPAIEWPFSDDFNRSTLGGSWTATGNPAEIASSSYLRATDNPPLGNGPHRAPVWLASSVAVAPSDDWQVSVKVANVPDAVQQTRFGVGASASNCLWARIGNSRITLGYTVNGIDTVHSELTGTQVAAGQTVTLKRGATICQVLVNGVMKTANTTPANVFTGVGNRNLFLDPAVYRGGFLNGTRYHSPGIDSVVWESA